MRHRRLVWFVVVPLALSLGAFALAEEKKGEEEKKGAEAKTGGELLESKGLRKSGQYYVLADEVALRKKLRELEPLRRKVFDAQKKAAEAEKVIEQKKQLINQCLQQRHDLEIQLNGVLPVDVHNRIVNAINELGDRIELLEKSVKEDRGAKALRAAATEISEHYVEAIIQLRKQCKELKAKYDALAADGKINSAIAEANAAESTKCKLGPSGDFMMVDTSLKKLEGNVVSETITMRRDDGDLWTVSVTFNGQHSADLTIDTGASTVVLPYKMATEVGLTPSEKDPTFTCILADGHTIKCKMVYAKTVRVGKFTVEHVECGVMPADCLEASAMLGQSYLKHFTFRIDNANGKLIMAQVGLPGDHRRGAGKQPAASKTEEAAEDKTGIPETAEAEKGGPEQMVKLLKLDNEKPSDRVDYTDSNGQPLQLSRSKWETMENLRKVGGDPDEIHKIPMKSRDPTAPAAPWKMYSWGPLVVVADDTSHARYFGLTKEKENTAAKRPAEVEAPAKAEPAPAAEEPKPRPKEPDVKPSTRPPVKDGEKDVFEK